MVDEGQGVIDAVRQSGVLADLRRSAAAAARGKGVFIVHGTNTGLRDSVARFLRDALGQEPVILAEQPSRGATVIEKFEANSDVGFAVVIMSADDRGGPASAPRDKQRLRARQNVIFELGYFIGKLGRRHVLALYEEGVEIPSDYSGVVYIPLDQAGGWKRLLANELTDAGIPIDLMALLKG